MSSQSEMIVLSEIEDLLDFVLKVQDRLAPDVVSQEETIEGEGRKGAIMVRKESGAWIRIFEVDGGKLMTTTSLDNVRTLIIFEKAEAFKKVCQELLAGSPGAFSRARAKGEVTLKGECAVRDLMVFNRLLSRVGQTLTSYGVKL